ncbi:MAG: acylneuraminate cytidylyltransferase family protein [Lachnospiraceae bacterium]|nr:acylneuraminate cytidylyltransferase family protein [Lachnospiraceae bacterium]
MNKIAIIPARSGSKGLKDKNIIDLCGRPLMAYSIEAAIKSRCFNRVIVSTDSEEYGKIAKQYGAEVMYRDAKLSDDKATTFMVLEDMLGRLKEPFDYFMLLQPTSPLRDENHVREAADKFERHMQDFDFLVSVKEAEHSAVLVKPIDEDESLKYFDTDFSNYRRQTYKEYSPNGAIFIAKPGAYLRQKHFFGAKSISYMMNRFDSVDIDDELDYELACICMDKKVSGRI